MIGLLMLAAAVGATSVQAAPPAPRSGEPIALEAPGYADEALRVERRTAWGRSIKALVVRHFGPSFVKVDYIDTTWTGSTIHTFNLDRCPALQSALSGKPGPSSFPSLERSASGMPVISPDGPHYIGAAKGAYMKTMGAVRASGNSLTPFGQWAERLLEIADVCRAPIS